MTEQTIKRGRGQPKGGIRNHLADIRSMRKAGASYQKIADKYGCSRQRIHQLLSETE